jgi:hypothetical protein
MRKLFAVAVLVAAVAQTSAAQSCSIASTAATPSPCTVTSTHSLTMPSLLSLTMAGFTSGTSQTLNAPADVSEFSSGNTIQVATTGPTFTVKANRAYKVQISAAAASFSGTSYAKPAADIAWSTASNGTFANLSTTAADLDAGGATAGSTSVGLFYKTTYRLLQDVPGTYSLDVKFTLVAP